MRSGVRRLVACGVLLGASLASAGACDDSVRSHVYSGRQYEPSRGCLDDVTSIDVVEGPEPSARCAPTCIASVPDDGGTSLLYVSQMCPPYPLYPYEADAGGDLRCTAALALYATNATCEADGSVYVYDPLDAAPDVLDGGAAGETGGAGAGSDGASATDAADAGASD